MKVMNVLTEMLAIFVILFTGRDCLGLGQYMHLRRNLLIPWVPKADYILDVPNMFLYVKSGLFWGF